MDSVLSEYKPGSILAAQYPIFNYLRQSMVSNLPRGRGKFINLSIKGITYDDEKIGININNPLYHICYGDVKGGRIISGGHLECMKKFKHRSIKDKSFFSKEYDRPEAIRKLIIEKIQQTNFEFCGEFNYNLSSKKYIKKDLIDIYVGNIEVPNVGTTIDGKVINCLEFVVYHNRANDKCLLVSCYPKIQ